MNLTDLLADKPVEAALNSYKKEMSQPIAIERMYEVDAVEHILREGTCIREALRAAWEAAELAQEQEQVASVHTSAKAESEVLDSSCAASISDLVKRDCLSGKDCAWPDCECEPAIWARHLEKLDNSLRDRAMREALEKAREWIAGNCGCEYYSTDLDLVRMLSQIDAALQTAKERG
jgi:hypothetical protein